MHSSDDLIMRLGVFNGHVVKHFDGVHVWYDVDQWNLKDECY